MTRLRKAAFGASVFVFGISYLLARWLPKLKAQILTVPCKFRDASHVLVVNSFGQTELVKVSRQIIECSDPKFQHILHENGTGQRCLMVSLEYRYNRFVLHADTGVFLSAYDLLPLCLPDVDYNMDGISSEKANDIRQFLGMNVIQVGEKSAMQTFCSEILHPFYVFQVISFFIWLLEDYYLYAIVILLMATGSAVLTVVETKGNVDKIRVMARFVCPVKVVRDGILASITSDDLVPGDLLILDETIDIIPCDGILVNGDAIVDESILTGETVPVTKVDIVDDSYKDILMHGYDNHQRSLLYSGTRLLRSRPRHGKPAMILVTCTGFLTIKGSLVQSIMFPRPNNFRFYRDSMLFIAILAVIAALGFSIAVFNFVSLGLGLYWIATRALDVITVVVPPALPATMAIGTVFAIHRLEAKQVFCISPPRINVASKVKVVCFDKTGTLTEEGLEILGVLSSIMHENGAIGFGEMLTSREDLVLSDEKSSCNLLRLMATCHSLRRVNNRLLGDSLDLKMFEFTGWELEEPIDVGEAFVPTIVRPPGSYPFSITHLTSPKGKLPASGSTNFATQEIGLVRQFDFCPTLRRMSIVARPLSEECLYVYTKGSPESLLNICRPDSIPKDYSKILSNYAHHGYRVIGCAAKPCPSLSWLKAQKMTRETAESNLIFAGFIVFENRLKMRTEKTIRTLRAADISCLMATGDNILTAISVGRASHMIDENHLVFFPTLYLTACSSRDVLWKCVDDVDVDFDPVELEPVGTRRPFALAISGEFFEWMHNSLPRSYLQLILPRCFIYARMSPQQKQLLVEVLQLNKQVVGFCGDGANDCGALKAADVGISLSQAEASVAAPFTSKIQDISCVPELLLEGRASLVTSFCCFKYMTMYSMIQFTTMIFLYSYGSTLSDGQFVYVDLILIIPLGILMSRYAPSKVLVREQPTAKLISVPMLTCILGHIFLQGLAQVVVYFALARSLQFEWEYPMGDESNTFHPTTSTMFLFSTFQYLGTAVIFSAGKPFRQQIYWPFFGYALLGTLSTIWALFYPPKWFQEWLYLTALDLRIRIWISIAAGLYIVSAFYFDRIMVPTILGWINRLSLTRTSR